MHKAFGDNPIVRGIDLDVPADEIADRLRREAEAVERRANLEGQTAVKIGLIEENTRLIVSRIVLDALKDLKMAYPQ